MEKPETFEAAEIVHNLAAERFELRVGDALCVLEYRRAPGKLVIYHTEVPPPYEGRGLAARMTRAALQFARAEKLEVEPRCAYTAAFIQKNREYSDLVANGGSGA
jgi:predicted GNAT family acetyltransferase